MTLFRPTRDKALGCFIGLAVGDALGAPVEFKARGTFKPVRGMRAGGPFNLKAGQWTDDTSMALCLADSIIAMGTIDEDDLLARWREWMDEGTNSSTGVCFDVGGGTRAVLNARSPRARRKAANGNGGNGSMMRMAPVMLRARDVRETHDWVKAQSRVTHSREASNCAVLLADYILRAFDDNRPCASPYDLAEGRKHLQSTGYCLHTFSCALWAVQNTSTFEAALLAAVNLGGDADTIGACAGQLAGALYGLGAIPAAWRRQLHDYDRLMSIGDQLYG